MEVLSNNGKTLHEFTTKKSVTTGGSSDVSAFYNLYAAGIKESVVSFLNTMGSQELIAASQKARPPLKTSAQIRTLLGDIKPRRSGTGFFVDSDGTLVTAAHVVDECTYISVQQKGNIGDAQLVQSSRLLDLAIIKSDFNTTTPVYFGFTGRSPNLGQPVFVTGFPLAGILSDYPSLTVGNISSLGGLKGAKGYIQFSAPVQPGNSGGPIIDYKGDLIGVVSSTLNQSMMVRSSGTTTQNVNFGVTLGLLEKYLNEHNVIYSNDSAQSNFEVSSQKATEQTVQVLCYQ